MSVPKPEPVFSSDEHADAKVPICRNLSFRVFHSVRPLMVGPTMGREVHKTHYVGHRLLWGPGEEKQEWPTEVHRWIAVAPLLNPI